MQNTIITEFENNPNVLTVIFDEGGRNGETREWLETFWNNYYLRGSVIFDESGEISQNFYGQPNTGLPFGRGFIINQNGIIALPAFGHNPAFIIDKIYELLESSEEDIPTLSEWGKIILALLLLVVGTIATVCRRRIAQNRIG